MIYLYHLSPLNYGSTKIHIAMVNIITIVIYWYIDIYSAYLHILSHYLPQLYMVKIYFLGHWFYHLDLPSGSNHSLDFPVYSHYTQLCFIFIVYAGLLINGLYPKPLIHIFHDDHDILAITPSIIPSTPET